MELVGSKAQLDFSSGNASEGQNSNEHGVHPLYKYGLGVAAAEHVKGYSLVLLLLVMPLLNLAFKFA